MAWCCGAPYLEPDDFEQKENHSDKNVPVARIPWIPLETGARLQPGVVDLEKSNYFKEMVDTKTNLQLFQLMNQVFPFYLPKRYHTMDSWNLHKSSKEGQYWANASHFLMANQGHDRIFFSNLLEELKKTSPDLSKFDPVFPPKSREFLLKDGLEQCTSAAEFLLEPWVLIQLPFQPILMYQWTAALMAEALKFQKEICDFYYIPYPTRFRMPLKQICSMCDKLLQPAMELYSCVITYFMNGHNNFHIIVVHGLNALSKKMTELMPILEFVLSSECRDVVKALKRMCWSRPAVMEDAEFRCPDIDDCDNFCNYEFWKSQTPLQGLQLGKPPVEFGHDKRLQDAFELNLKDKAMSIDDLANMKELINANVIKPGRVKGAERDTLLKAAKGGPLDLKYVYYLYTIFSETSSATKVVDDANAGVIYNIISLYSDLRVAETMAMLTARLAATFDKVYVNATADCEGPNLDVKFIQKRLSKVLVPNKKWKYQNILARVKETCFSPSRTTEPNFKQGAKKIADHFQERIKNLVFKMIEAQSKTINGPFSYYPECQVVQYLLPCFVASFLDLNQDPSASAEEKEKYLLFVHEMVKSYEDMEFCQKLSLDYKTMPFTSAVQTSEVLSKKVMHWQQNVIKTLTKVSSSKVISQFCEKGLALLCNCSHKHYPSPRCFKIDEFYSWTLQLHMILCRTNSVLEKLTWLCDAPFHSFAFMFAIGDCLILSKRGRVFVCEDFLIMSLMSIVNQEYPDRFTLRVMGWNLIALSHMQQDFLKITCVQLFGIVMFQYMSSLEADYLKMLRDKVIQGPGFPLDSTDAVFWSILSQDRWKVMQQLCTFLDSKLFRDSSYLASLTFAKSNEFYSPVLELISSEGKVKMNRPGEITFFPLKHCRWCGLVDVEEFRTCPECLDNPEYLDVNFFCSEECEKKCLEKQHTEEHARFLLMKCDIDV